MVIITRVHTKNTAYCDDCGRKRYKFIVIKTGDKRFKPIILCRVCLNKWDLVMSWSRAEPPEEFDYTKGEVIDKWGRRR